VQIGVVDHRVTLDGGPAEPWHRHRDGIGDGYGHPWIGLDVLEFPREQHARGHIDLLPVIQRDQRVRDGPSFLVDHGQLADQSGIQELFDGLR
jgi:hypothetical protein